VLRTTWLCSCWVCQQREVGTLAELQSFEVYNLTISTPRSGGEVGDVAGVVSSRFNVIVCLTVCATALRFPPTQRSAVRARGVSDPDRAAENAKRRSAPMASRVH